MPNICSSSLHIVHLTSIGPFSNSLPSTVYSEPIKQGCRSRVGFLGFFGDFDKKIDPALSISHILLRIRYTLKDSEGFFALFGKKIAKMYMPPSIYRECSVCRVRTQ